MQPETVLKLRSRLLSDLVVGFGPKLQADREDIVQLAFVELMRYSKDVTSDDDGLYRCLRTIARRNAIDRIRSQRRARTKLGELPQPSRLGHRPPTDTDFPYQSTDQASSRIWDIYCALGDLERLVLWKHVIEGRSIRSIAAEQNMSWHSVAGIIESALDRVRSHVSGDAEPSDF